MKEIKFKYLRDTIQHFGIYAMFTEDFINIGTTTRDLLGKPDHSPIFLFQFFLYQFSDRYHFLSNMQSEYSHLPTIKKNKDVGDILSSIPCLRLSHAHLKG